MIQLASIFVLFANVVLLADASGIYCGAKNCYDVLGVKESANHSEVVNTYRKLARMWHPDKNNHRRAEAEKRFSEIAHAYGILSAPGSRKDYDYALRHPEEFAYNHAKYYYRQFYTKHMQMNPVFVLILGLLGWSALEWFSRTMTYKEALQRVRESREFKMSLKRLKEDKLFEMERQGIVKKKLNGKRTRKEIEAIEVDEQPLLDQVRILGSIRKPQWTELAIVQFWLVPLYAYKALSWQFRWFIRYTIQKQPYSLDDQEYLTRSVLNWSDAKWQAVDSKVKKRMLAKELWISENEKIWKKEERRRAIDDSADDDFGE